jgi:hypothetical protein
MSGSIVFFGPDDRRCTANSREQPFGRDRVRRTGSSLDLDKNGGRLGIAALL